LIYCRVSGANQKKDGTGLDSQEHRCRQYAEQNDWDVEKVFQDDFTGGGDFMKRPAMRELLAYLDCKPYNRYVVIFDDLKRFARDVEFHWKLRKTLKERNASPKCLNYNFDDSPEGHFIETVLAAQGELERKQNRRQVIQKQKARLERGYWPFFPPPGYKHIKDLTHGKLLVPDEPKASIIREARRGFANGRFEDQEDVRKFLQKKDFWDGRPIHMEQVKRLLMRVLYAGYVEYLPWEVSRRKGFHEALDSLVIHQKIQDKLDGKIKLRTRKDTHEDFPLRGFVLCSKCREPFTAAWSKGKNAKFPYYRCRKKGCEEHNKSIRKEKIENEFQVMLIQKQPPESTLNGAKALMLRCWTKKTADLDEIYKQRRKELESIEEEISMLTTRACKTGSERMAKIYEKQIEELGKKELLLREKTEDNATPRIDFEHALDEVVGFLKNPYFSWINGDLDQKRLVLKLVFEEQLAYDRNNLFEHPYLSLPLRVMEVFERSKSQAVEMVRKSLNTLEERIFEYYELLQERYKEEYREAA